MYTVDDPNFKTNVHHPAKAETQNKNKKGIKKNKNRKAVKGNK